jgi:glycosyltransferase involved in cell wall biosynthesis
MIDRNPSWICFQLGARRHYADPRVLHQAGKLAYLITDAWVPPKSPISRIFNWIPGQLGKRLSQRYHPDLKNALVFDFTLSLLRFEGLQSLQKSQGWRRTIARNQWFQNCSVRLLEKLSYQFSEPPIVFAYSYAALEIFKYAKQQGWHTVLGQINPGIVEENIVRAEYERHPRYQSSWQPAPSEYWSQWKQECELADRIIVNSFWSSQALQKTGIPVDKITIIPLAYEPQEEASNFIRTYPKSFSVERPLRVLFLGQITLRKGVAALLKSAEKLGHRPIEFWLIGHPEIALPRSLPKNIHWFNSVPRNKVNEYYKAADLFIFPTLSDGFGLTQLEAQSWKLPIVASPFCGSVVKHGENGFLLSEVTSQNICKALEHFIDSPPILEKLSRNSYTMNSFSMSTLESNLVNFELKI